MKRSRSTLIVFMKTPRIGGVKSRLAKSIGVSQAMRFYCYCLENQFAELIQPSDFRVAVYVSDSIKLHNYHSFISRKVHFDVYLQQGNNLGERMLHALKEQMRQSNKVVLMGSDCLQLSLAYISSAFDCLNTSNDLVIGPSNDGGYVLIGMRKVYPQIFQRIGWSTNRVLEQTWKSAKIEGLSIHYLPTLVDIDDIDDLKLFIDQHPKFKFRSGHHIGCRRSNIFKCL